MQKKEKIVKLEIYHGTAHAFSTFKQRIIGRMADDAALLQGLRKVGLTAPPPGFASMPPAQQPNNNQPMEFDEVHLSSIFRLALDDDGVFRPQENAAQHPMQQGGYPPPTHFHPGPPQQGHPGQFPPQFQPQPMLSQQDFLRMQQFQQQSGPPMGYSPQQAPPGSPFQRPMPVSPMIAPFQPMPMMQGMPPRGGMPFVPMHQQMPPFSPQMQPQQETRDLRFKDYERMKGREIAFIVRSQLRTVETGDDFADDFYFLQAKEKARVNPGPSQIADNISNDERPAELLKVLKAIQSRSAGETGGSVPMIRAPVGPLPELSGGKTPQQEAIERRGKQIATAATKWAGVKNVLGRSTKGNLRTPRELIALQEAILFDDSNKEGKKECFSSAGWNQRRVTMEVADALGEVTDLSRHLKARAAALPAGPMAVGWEYVHEKLRELESQQMQACNALAKSMGLVDGDDALLLALLWLPKGRRTSIRAMKSLLPEHLVLFLEAAARLLVYFTCTSPDGKTSSEPMEKEKYDLDMLAASALAREYSTQSLEECTKCLKMFLESQSPESLRAVIATPGGAQVTKSLLIHGQELSESDEQSDAKARWNEAFSTFISMAEEGITAKEASRT